MVATAASAVLTGVEAAPVTVEVDLADGLPTFTVVGLPDVSVQESRDRVRAAIQGLGVSFPMRRITVNLAPSDVRKHGTNLDLAVALGLLTADAQAPRAGLDGRLFLGELGLAGDVRGVRGALAAAEAARRHGYREMVCSLDNAAEAALAGIPVLPVATLKEAVELLRGNPPERISADASSLLRSQGCGGLDLGQIRGQKAAKRALELAAAGGHNLLLAGPPGAGKTLLARALPGVLPRMTVPEALEVTRIWSAAGLLPRGEAIVRTRPFRSPHHGVSAAGLIGSGSSWIRPGEISLAHRGVLMMDEFPEFPRNSLEALRQPIEDGVVTVTRARTTVTYPARFMLVAAMNPCPCGHAGSDVPCRCTPRTLEIYKQRLSGPLLDRIDLRVDVSRVETEDLLEEATEEPSAAVRERVERARRAAVNRDPRWTCNAEIGPSDVIRACVLTAGARSRLTDASRQHKLSARSVHRVMRVARTIADLVEGDVIEEKHICEALTFRVKEGGQG